MLLFNVNLFTLFLLQIKEYRMIVTILLVFSLWDKARQDRKRLEEGRRQATEEKYVKMEVQLETAQKRLEEVEKEVKELIIKNDQLHKRLNEKTLMMDFERSQHQQREEVLRGELAEALTELDAAKAEEESRRHRLQLEIC